MSDPTEPRPWWIVPFAVLGAGMWAWLIVWWMR